jgi:carbohydrate-binding DOMON domain-containing protein
MSGPAQITVPDLGLTTPVLEIADPEGDDYGPGSYVYPSDGVFKPGVFDATSFRVGYDGTDVAFRLTLRGPLENVWDSPNGVSVQTLDIYIDKDGPGNGQRLLLPGRNAALVAGHAWDYAIWVEGWTPGVFVPGDEGPVQVGGAQVVVIPDAGQSKITVKVPQSVLGDDPENWAYATVVLSQDGYPSAGVWRVRDVNPDAQQWRLGGGPEDENHTRIIDLLWPADAVPTQEEMLSTYAPSQQAASDLVPDDFAQLEMLWP